MAWPNSIYVLRKLWHRATLSSRSQPKHLTLGKPAKTPNIPQVPNPWILHLPNLPLPVTSLQRLNPKISRLTIPKHYHLRCTLPPNSDLRAPTKTPRYRRMPKPNTSMSRAILPHKRANLLGSTNSRARKSVLQPTSNFNLLNQMIDNIYMKCIIKETDHDATHPSSPPHPWPTHQFHDADLASIARCSSSFGARKIFPVRAFCPVGSCLCRNARLTTGNGHLRAFCSTTIHRYTHGHFTTWVDHCPPFSRFSTIRHTPSRRWSSKSPSRSFFRPWTDQHNDSHPHKLPHLDHPAHHQPSCPDTLPHYWHVWTHHIH